MKVAWRSLWVRQNFGLIKLLLALVMWHVTWNDVLFVRGTNEPSRMLVCTPHSSTRWPMARH
jgi:hypothetical protein